MFVHFYREKSRGSEGWGVPDHRLVGAEAGRRPGTSECGQGLPVRCDHLLAASAPRSGFNFAPLSWNVRQEGVLQLCTLIHPLHRESLGTVRVLCVS